MPALSLRIVLVLLLGIVSSLHAGQASVCTLTESDRSWIGEITGRWNTISREVLRKTPGPLPWTVFFNEACAWQLRPGASIEGSPHDGQLRLPDGQDVAVRLMTFVGTYGDDQAPFMVMAMPSIWRAEPRH